jgi:DNA-binding response OmpR family regulator
VKFNLLEIGADAFITKPFDPTELMLTVKAVCRRVFPSEHSVSAMQWRFVPCEWLLIAPNGESIGLTVIETQFLDILQRNRGKAVSRLKIGDALGDLHRYSGNALEAVVSRLRKKICAAYPGVAVVKAAPGIGYVLSNDVV